MEFRQYKRQDYINYINNTNDINEDIRYRFLHNQIDEKNMKSLLHTRNKKSSFKKTVYEIIISTTDIMENFIWSIFDIIENNNEYTQNNKNKNGIDNMYA